MLGSTLRPSARAGAGPGPGRELRPDKTCAHLPATARPLPGCHWPLAGDGGQPPEHIGDPEMMEYSVILSSLQPLKAQSRPILLTDLSLPPPLTQYQARRW